MANKEVSINQLIKENEELRQRLSEAENALEAIRLAEQKQAHQVLKESEDRFRTVAKRYDTLFKNTTNGMAHCRIITDENGKPVDYTILQINDAYERIIGVRKADIEGRKVTEVFPDIRNYALDYIGMYGKIALENGEIKFEEFFEASQQYLSIYAYCPAPGEFIAIFTNVTERIQAVNELRESEERFRTIAETVPVLVCVTRIADNVILFTNEVNNKAFRYKGEDIIGTKGPDYYCDPVDRQKMMELFSKEGSVNNYQLKVKKSDGTPFWILTSVRQINYYGQPALIGASIDISQRINDEQEKERLLHEIESQAAWLDASISSMATGIILYGLDSKAIRMNETAKRLLPEELIFNMNIKERSDIFNWETEDGKPFPVEEIPVYRAIHGETTKMVVLVACFSNRKIYLSVNAAPILNSQGKILGVVASFLDITENKETELALRESEERYHQMFDQHHAVGLLIEPESGDIIDANSAALKYYGYSYEQLCSLQIQDINQLPPYEVEAERKRALEEQRDYFVFPHRLANGELRWVEVYSSPLSSNGRQLLYSLIHDITSRKTAEESLRVSEERYRNLFSVMPSGVAVYEVINDGNDPDGKDFIFRDMNPAGEKIDHVHREEIIGKSLFDFFPSVREMGLLDALQRVWMTGVPEYFPVTLYADSKIALWVTNYIWKLPSGELVALFDDITEAKKLEGKLRESENRFRNLVKNAPTAICEVDFKTRKFISVNDAMCELTGYSKDELFSLDSLELLADESKELFISRIKELNNGKKVEETVEYKVRAKDGHYIDAVLRMKFNYNEEGIPVGLMVVGHDITERKKAEESLKESEKKLSLIQENMSEGLMLFDNKGNVIYQNPASLTIHGYNLNEAIENRELLVTWKGWDEQGRPLNYDEWPLSRVIRGEYVKDQVLRARRDDTGHEFIGSYNGCPICNEKGNIAFAFITIHDISDRIMAEDALKESETRFRTLAENIPDLIVRFDKDLRFLYGNKAVLKRTGLSLDFLTGKTASEYAGGSPSVRNWEKAAREVIKKGVIRRIEQANIWLDKPVVYDSLLIPEKDSSGNVTSLVAIARDISEMKKAENILRVSEQRLKYHLENSPLAVVEWDKDFHIIQWSNEAEKIFGLSKEEVLGVRIDLLNIIYPEDIPIVEKTSARLLSGKELKVVSQNRNITKSGEVLECIWYNSVLLDENSEMSSVMSLVADVTLLRKTERELIASQEKYKELVTNARSMILKFDNDGRFTFINEFALDYFGYKEEELLGKSVMIVVPEKESTGRDLNEMVENIVEDPDTYSININENIKKNGEKVWVEWHNKTLFDESGRKTGHIAIGLDITIRKTAEQSLIQSEERFRTIAESLTVMVVIKRASDSIISFMNEPFAKSFGFRKQDLIGKIIPDIYYYPEDNDFLHDLLKIKGAVENMEIKVKRNDGTSFWIMTSFRQINFNNEPSYLMTSIDISETKRAQEELLRLNRTLDAQSKSSKALMHATDETGYLNEICKIIIEDCGYSMVWVGYAMNDALKSVKPVAHFGFDKGYIEQMKISWDDNDRGRGPTGVAIRTGKISTCKNMHTDPCFCPWREAAIARGYQSSLVIPLKTEGKVFGAVSIYSKDPDPFSESEINLLAELVDDLAYGIEFIRLTEYEKEATRAIKENEVRLKELILTKDKFFNIIAHDLKNPFTSLLGASEILYDNINQMTHENIKKLSLILNDSAKGGYAILQNLLDWSRSQTGMLKFNPENTNLKIIIDENIENLQLQISNKEISLKSELIDDLFLVADKNMINTVLRNLLSNAIKYTYKNGSISVRVFKCSEEIIVSVKDKGIGITKEKAESLFRLENSLSLPGTEKEQGTGLGLKLCKEFTEKMGGRIWVESEVGKGSEFKFSIPLS